MLDFLPKKVIIMVGYPGSGKSTLAKKISKEYSYHLLNADLIRKKLFNTSQLDLIGDSVIYKQRKIVNKAMYKQAVDKVIKGEKVIIDASHLNTKRRKQAISILLEKIDKNNICFIVLKTPKKEIVKRLKKVNKRDNNKETFFESWKRVYGYFEERRGKGLLSWPSKSEGIDVVDGTEVVIKPKWIKDIKMIGFDLDGTLYPNNKEIGRLMKKKQMDLVAAKLKLSRYKAEYEFNKVLKKLKSNTKSLDYLGIDGLKFCLDFWDNTNLSKYIHKDDALKNMLLKLKKQVRFSIFSNSNKISHIKKKLSLIGIPSNIFNPIVSSVDIGCNKPDLKAFKGYIKKTNLKPHQILYIGDRVNVDIVPAKKAGMRASVVYDVSFESDLSLQKPHDLINYFI